jgi:septum formation protein
MEKAMFAKKMAANRAPTTPILKIPNSGGVGAKNTDEDARFNERSPLKELTEEERKYAPSSPTDNMLSPASKLIYRKRPLTRKASKVFSLSNEVPKRICPLPHGCPLILGSSSSNRKNILEAIHWHFTVMVPGIDEKAIRSEDYLELPNMIAKAKADAILKQLEDQNYLHDCIVLTSDQIVLYRGSVREKPADEAEAISFLSSYSDSSATTVSAVVATHYPSRRQESEVDIATVHWHTIPMDVICAVVDRGQIFTAAGGFIIEDPDLYPLVKSVEGTIDSVLGMPVDATVRVISAVLEESEDSNAQPKSVHEPAHSISRNNSNSNTSSSSNAHK